MTLLHRVSQPRMTAGQPTSEVAAAGPATNIMLAILAALAFHLFGYLPVTAAEWVAENLKAACDAGIEVPL